jgi:hypothetical protein
MEDIFHAKYFGRVGAWVSFLIVAGFLLYYSICWLEICVKVIGSLCVWCWDAVDSFHQEF